MPPTTVKMPRRMAAIQPTWLRPARAHAHCGRRAASSSPHIDSASGTANTDATTTAHAMLPRSTAPFLSGSLGSGPMSGQPGDLRSIAGRVAVVTGAASGMGAATARLFAQEGALVAAVDRAPEDARRIADEITDAGGRAVGIGADLSDR